MIIVVVLVLYSLFAVVMNLFSICRYPNLKSVKDLIYKKGLAKLENDKVPLTDNNVIEQVSDCRLLQLSY